MFNSITTSCINTFKTYNLNSIPKRYHKRFHRFFKVIHNMYSLECGHYIFLNFKSNYAPPTLHCEYCNTSQYVCHGSLLFKMKLTLNVKVVYITIMSYLGGYYKTLLLFPQLKHIIQRTINGDALIPLSRQYFKHKSLIGNTLLLSGRTPKYYFERYSITFIL